MKSTKPFHLWEGVTAHALAKFEKSTDREKDLDTVEDIANGASFAMFGENAKDSIVKTSPEIESLFDGIDFDGLPGGNPIEKALAYTIAKKRADGKSSPLSKPVVNGEEFEEALANIAGMMDDPMLKDALKGETGGIEDAMMRAAYNGEMYYLLRAMKHVRALGSAYMHQPKKIIETLEGDFYLYRDIEKLSEIAKARGTDLAIHPILKLKLMQRSLQVRIRHEEARERESVVICIDNSGSMSTHFKQAYVKALLLYYANKLQKGEADVWVVRFVWNVDTLKPFKDAKELKEFALSYRNGGGGDTYVANVIDKIQKLIKAGNLPLAKKGQEARMVIVNDGQDPIDPNTVTIAPLNVLSLEQDNKDLKTVALKSGGSFTLITETSKIALPSASLRSIITDEWL